MSDILSRGFKAQLTTAMDSISRRAVFEIMKIFENTLYDNQMELVQKGEEVAQLKIKLQRAELKLKDLEDGIGRHMEMNKVQTNPLQTKDEVVMETPGQTSEVPEIDFEVPDDWCAPLGCETVTKPDEGVCPSVRLRPLSIPLWHIPVPKNEVVRCDIDLDQRKEGARRSSRISNLNERTKPSKDKKLPGCDQKVKCQPLRNDVKLLLHDIKEEYPDQITLERLRRRTNLAGKKQENKVKSKTEQRKSVATEPMSKEQEIVEDGSKNAYSCKICKKVFNTEFGRSVHVRSHKKCRGCKKIFPCLSTLMYHKPYCRKLKKLLAREAADTPFDEEGTRAPNEKQADNKESPPCSRNHNHQGHKNAGRYPCTHCNKTFDFRFRLIEHMRVHTGEKPYSCSICQKTFRIAQSLKVHMVKRHNDQNRDINGDLSWTKPLEEIEEKREDPVSPSKRTSREIEQNKGRRRSERTSRWQTMGVQHNHRFMCLSCNKVLRNKANLIEHYRIHTGEKPLKCDRCTARFRTNAQLYVHKKKCRYPAVAVQCEKCEKKLSSQSAYNKHVSKCKKVEQPALD